MYGVKEYKQYKAYKKYKECKEYILRFTVRQNPTLRKALNGSVTAEQTGKDLEGCSSRLIRSNIPEIDRARRGKSRPRLELNTSRVQVSSAIAAKQLP